MPKIVPYEKSVDSNKQIEHDYIQNIQNNINSLEYIHVDSQELTAPSSEEDLSFQQFSDNVIFEKLVGYNFSVKISNLFYRLQQNPCMLSLVIDVPFQYQNVLVNFATQISKISKYVKYLKWNLNSLFTISKYEYVVGDTLAQFSNLYKVELQFNSVNSFTRKGLASLFDAIKKLKNIHIFKFNIEQNGCFLQQNSVLVQSMEKILKDQVFSDKLEIIKSNILDFSNFTHISNLSVYYFNLNYEYYFEKVKSITNKFSHNLVKISFNQNIIDMFDRLINTDRSKELVQFFKQINEYRYLTKLKITQWKTTKSLKQRNYLNMIKKNKDQQYIKLLEIAAYEKIIKQYMIVNPRFATADFWIN